jgi:GDP-D-mannose dehydratase
VHLLLQKQHPAQYSENTGRTFYLQNVTQKVFLQHISTLQHVHLLLQKQHPAQYSKNTGRPFSRILKNKIGKL